MAEETISDAIDFLKIVKTEKEVIVKFIKKDGTVRLMRATLDFSLIPRDKRPKSVDLPKILNKIQKSKILSIFDLDKNEWRSVPFDRLEYVKTSQRKVYKLGKII